MSQSPKFDVLAATAADLQALLNRGVLSSAEIVDTYLAQIEAHNRQGLNLRAIAAVAPREIVLRRARELDQERQFGRVRAPLHGIPVILKVPRERNLYSADGQKLRRAGHYRHRTRTRHADHGGHCSL